MVSATADAAAAANAAFQAAPSWLTRANTPSANDLFGNLVNQNTPNDSAAAQPPAPPQQNNADAAPPPPPDNNRRQNNAAPITIRRRPTTTTRPIRRHRTMIPATRQMPTRRPTPTTLIPARTRTPAVRRAAPPANHRPRPHRTRRKRPIRSPRTRTPTRIRPRWMQPSWLNRSALPRRRRLPSRCRHPRPRPMCPRQHRPPAARRRRWPLLRPRLPPVRNRSRRRPDHPSRAKPIQTKPTRARPRRQRTATRLQRPPVSASELVTSSGAQADHSRFDARGYDDPDQGDRARHAEDRPRKDSRSGHRRLRDQLGVDRRDRGHHSERYRRRRPRPPESRRRQMPPSRERLRMPQLKRPRLPPVTTRPLQTPPTQPQPT